MADEKDPATLTREMEAASAATRAFGLDTERVLKSVSDEFRKAKREGRDFGDALGNAFEGIAGKGRSLSDTLKKLALDLSRMAVERAAGAISNSLAGGITNLLGGLIGTATASASGNVISDGRVMPFAKGGVVSSPMLFPLRGGTGLAGEAGAEAILPLRRGADGRLGVAGDGGSALNVTFNVTAADAESFRRSEGQIAAMLSRVAGRGQRNM
ncbi:MAG: phage tail protein [Alphaproteobacteria bacterium HGW-Alphaproteobacteria-12]|nr:MAG: phage tail protein [Alphaproteobacteria bacterium HGW-Alphaproteobacteria-12]